MHKLIRTANVQSNGLELKWKMLRGNDFPLFTTPKLKTIVPFQQRILACLLKARKPKSISIFLSSFLSFIRITSRHSVEVAAHAPLTLERKFEIVFISSTRYKS
jgi:hypothetical protein